MWSERLRFRILLVNLSMTLSSVFLILKDLQRKRLAVRLTRALDRSIRMLKK